MVQRLSQRQGTSKKPSLARPGFTKLALWRPTSNKRSLANTKNQANTPRRRATRMAL